MTNLFFQFLLFIFMVSGTPSQPSLGYFQLWLQCDEKWAQQKIGTSSKTICDEGSLMTSASMVVAGLPVWWADPGVMNQWLKQNNGYKNGDQFIWTSIEKLGFKFGGTSNDRKKIKSHVDSNHSIIANVKNQSHWAVITSINDNQTVVVLYDPVRKLIVEDIENVRSYAWYQKLKMPNNLQTKNNLKSQEKTIFAHSSFSLMVQ